MPEFADSFWSKDYSSGITPLFDKLQQGINENASLSSLIADRIGIELICANKLQCIPTAHYPAKQAFGGDAGATVKKAYEGFLLEMETEGFRHARIAKNLQNSVQAPFVASSEAHKNRIHKVKETLFTSCKAYDKQLQLTHKSQKSYFAKSRALEDLKTEADLVFPVPTTESPNKGLLKRFSYLAAPTPPPKDNENGSVINDKQLRVSNLSNNNADYSETLDSKLSQVKISPIPEITIIGGMQFTQEALQLLFQEMLKNIPRGPYRVPILGVYSDVSTGDQIVLWIRKNFSQKFKTVAKLEAFGQDLIDLGYLRLVGNVGKRFSNSSSQNYQWQQSALDIAYPNKQDKLVQKDEENPLTAATAKVSDFIAKESIQTKKMGAYISGVISNTINNVNSNDSLIKKAQKEATEANEKYKTAVKLLDELRCKLEEDLVDNLRLVEGYELERLETIKITLQNMTAALGTDYKELKISLERMSIFYESIKPEKDLAFVIENYKCGFFSPTPVVYTDYFGKDRQQTFGIDLSFQDLIEIDTSEWVAPSEDAARELAENNGENEDESSDQAADESALNSSACVLKVPEIVVSFLTHLEKEYPKLTSNFERKKTWTQNVSLSSIHKLRADVNTGIPCDASVFSNYTLPVIAGTLVLFFLELPDAVVSTGVYDMIKSIYNTEYADDDARYTMLSTTLAQLSPASIGTLRYIIRHFELFFEKYASSTPEYQSTICNSLSYALLRPRVDSLITMNDKHGAKFLSDLFQHGPIIFQKLVNIQHQSQMQSNKSRKQSSSESNRRALMEARNAAIVAAAGGIAASGTNATNPSLLSPNSAYHSPSSSLTNVAAGNGILPFALSHSRSRSGSASSRSSNRRVSGQFTGLPVGSGTTTPEARLSMIGSPLAKVSGFEDIPRVDSSPREGNLSRGNSEETISKLDHSETEVVQPQSNHQDGELSSNLETTSAELDHEGLSQGVIAEEEVPENNEAEEEIPENNEAEEETLENNEGEKEPETTSY